MLIPGDRVTLKRGSSVYLTDVSGEVLEVHGSGTFISILGDQSGQWQKITIDDIAEVHESKKGSDERESGGAMLYHDQPNTPCRHVGPDTGTSAPPDSEQVSPSST